MKQKWPTIAAAILLIVSCPILLVVGLILFQKPFMPLIINGKVIAVVRQPFLRPIWNDGSADVYVGGNKIFSLPENFLDGSPVFIYPFADGRRFLCDYDDDTSLLDFVVDFSALGTNTLISSKWPPDDYTRTYMASRVTNVVFDTKGIVRLPNYAELQEVSSYLISTTPTSIKAGYFELFNFWTKENLLLDLATNRQSVWPMKK